MKKCIRCLVPFRPQGSYIQYAVLSQDFPKFPQNFPQLLSKYLYSKLYIRLSIHQKEMIFFAFERAFVGFNLIYWTPITGSYFLYGSILEKCRSLEKRPFFQADMSGLGKYHTGGYGRIGVYTIFPHTKSDFIVRIMD